MERKRLYRLPPCPDYDVEGTESWLEDMARAGWLLAQDGIFLGMAAFERAQPQTLRYRLAAAREPTGLFSDSMGYPDKEEQDLSAQLGWQYVGTRGDFYIYRSADPAARELDTDPAVQVLALEAVRKRQRSRLITSFFWLILYPLAHMRGMVALPLVEMGAPYLMLWALALWALAKSGAEYFHLRRLKRQLAAGESLTHRADWQRRQKGRRALGGLNLALWVLTLTLFVRAWDYHENGATPMANYAGTPPFATMADFAGEGAVYQGDTMPDYSDVLEWSNFVAPENMKWAQHDSFTRPDGSTFDGGYYVAYNRLSNEALAKLLAGEYARKDRWDYRRMDHFTEVELPALPVDEARAYRALWPTVVLRKGNVVVHAMLYQIVPEGSELDLGEWAAILAESLSVKNLTDRPAF